MDRKIALISETIAKLIINQLVHELKNYTLYKSFANYYNIQGIENLQKYYEKRAEEEMNHHNWCYSYLSDADIQFVYPHIDLNVNAAPKNYITPFIDTIDREIETTQLIYKIYDQCVREGDLMTMSWLLEKLIKEQIEEENISRMARVIMEEDADIFVKSEKVLNLL